MDEALRFFRTYETWIYLLLAFGAAIYVRKFVLHWQEMRGAVFGLEREQAQARLNQAAAALILLIIFGVAEFLLVTFIVPLRPAANPLGTPTLDFLATPTITLPAAAAAIAPIEALETPTPAPTADLAESTCLPGQVEITSPAAGEKVSGDTRIEGSAFVSGFGFYKVEVALQSDPLWRTIQAGTKARQGGVLVEKWDTSTLAPGNYVLQLVVTDASGAALPPCRVSVVVAAAP